MKPKKALSKIMPRRDKVAAMSHSHNSRGKESMPRAEAVPCSFQTNSKGKFLNLFLDNIRACVESVAPQRHFKDLFRMEKMKLCSFA